MENTIEKPQMETIQDSLKNSVSYQEYRNMVHDHTQRGTSTGPDQTEALSQYTLLNDSRMRRLDKTTKIPEDIIHKFTNFKGSQTWLVITESWCGDAAHSMPVMNKLASFSEKIDLRVVLRDENPELMDLFLTNGTRSIPKLIVIDNKTNTVVGDWGPRPSVASGLVHDFKLKNGSLTPEFKKDLQVWYNKDKGQNSVEDLAQLI